MDINNSNYSNIYLLSDRDLKNAFNAICTSSKINDKKLFDGNFSSESPIVFEYHYGENLYDLVSFGFPGLYLLSNKAIQILIENDISGWKIYPCILKDKEFKEINGYSIFSVLGKCGQIDRSKSEKYFKKYTREGKPAETYKGLYFEWDTWDGSDIFSPKDSLYTFVSERVRSIFNEKSITNIMFDRITEIETLVLNKSPAIDPDLLNKFGLDF